MKPSSTLIRDCVSTMTGLKFAAFFTTSCAGDLNFWWEQTQTLICRRSFQFKARQGYRVPTKYKLKMFLIKLTIVIFILFFQWQIHYEFYSGSQFVLIWRINWQYSIISLRSIYDSSQGKPFQRFYLFVDSWHGIHLSQKKSMKYSSHRKLLCELSKFNATT